MKSTFLKSLMLTIPLLSAPIFGASSSSSSSSDERVELSSLDQLRQQCHELKQNDQMKPFRIKVECSGHYTFWVNKADQTEFSNQSTMYTQTGTKCGRFQTAEQEYNQSTEPFSLSCMKYTKKEVSAPQGVGIPIQIGSCEELSQQNLQELCKEKLVEYCEDNMDGNEESMPMDQCSAPKSDGMCTVRDVDTVNTCNNY